MKRRDFIRAAAGATALGAAPFSIVRAGPSPSRRLNIAVIAFKWDAPVRYFPTWMEIEVTLAVIFAEILVFRWIVNRMPVLSEPPSWASDKGSQRSTERYTAALHEQEPLAKEI